MTNEELKELKISTLKQSKKRLIIEIGIFILINICLFIYFIIGSLNETQNDFNMTFFVVIGIFSLVFFAHPFYVNFKEQKKFINLKLNEYKTRFLTDMNIDVTVKDYDNDKQLKKAIHNDIASASFVYGKPNIYNVLTFNYKDEIIKRYEVATDQGNKNNQGFIYVLKSEKYIDLNLKTINYNSNFSNYKVMNKKQPFILYNKNFYKNVSDVSLNKQVIIKKIFDKFSIVEKKNINLNSLYGVTMSNGLIYLFISKGMSEKFSNVLDFNKDYDKFKKEMMDIYEVNDFIKNL